MTDTLRETAPATAPATARAASAGREAVEARLRAYARVSLEHLTALRQRMYAVAVGDDRTIWSDKPASPAEAVRYARDGAWCSPDSRFWRAFGRLYAATVAIPATVALDIAEWLIQRPGRLAAALFLVLIFSWIF